MAFSSIADDSKLLKAHVQTSKICYNLLLNLRKFTIVNPSTTELNVNPELGGRSSVQSVDVPTDLLRSQNKGHLSGRSYGALKMSRAEAVLPLLHAPPLRCQGRVNELRARADTLICVVTSAVSGTAMTVC